MELVLPCRAVSPAVTPELGTDAGSEGGTEEGIGMGGQLKCSGLALPEERFENQLVGFIE